MMPNRMRQLVEYLLALLLAAIVCAVSIGAFVHQQLASRQTKPSTTVPAPATSGPPPNPNAHATAAEHKDMMEQLGIRVLRPGPSGDESAPNHANYDEALAKPSPNLPDPLTMKNGTKVTSAETWWRERRP